MTTGWSEQDPARILVTGCSSGIGRALCAELHKRMPVVLAPNAWPTWLGEEPADEAQLKSLLVPYPSDGMIAWPVSPLVGSVRNNDPSLIEPIVLH